MQSNYPKILKKTLEWEGGWSDHPDDKGGATMRGVTIGTYSQYLGRQATKEELKDIPEEHIKDIYKNMFWNKVFGDQLPSKLDACVFDFAVNSGPSRAVRMLQGFAGSTPDGAMGPKTLAATNEWVKSQGADVCVYEYQARRQHYLESLQSFIVFGKGWTRRVDDIEQFALTLR
jgi:lysozyme family protein